MARIGKYRYPVIDLDKAKEYLKVFMDKCKGDATRDVFVTEVLGLSPRSSRPIEIIAALSQYGLVTVSKGKITITERGKLAIYGEEDEQVKALAEAAKSVPLIRDYYAKYGSEVSIDKVRIFLREIAGAEVDEARREAPSIQRIISCGIKHITEAESMEETKEESETLVPTSMPTPPSSRISTLSSLLPESLLPEEVDAIVIVKDYGILIVKDITGLNIAEAVLKGLRVKYESHKKEEKMPSQELESD